MGCIVKTVIAVKMLIFNLGLTKTKKNIFTNKIESLKQTECLVDHSETVWFGDIYITLTVKNLNRVIIADLTINSLSNKFNCLV